MSAYSRSVPITGILASQDSTPAVTRGYAARVERRPFLMKGFMKGRVLRFQRAGIRTKNHHIQRVRCRELDCPCNHSSLYRRPETVGASEWSPGSEGQRRK